MAEWECDICGLTPCPNRSFCKACRKIDRKRPPGREAREPRPDFPALAQSTKDATDWLRRYHRNRLPRWYQIHPGLEHEYPEPPKS